MMLLNNKASTTLAQARRYDVAMMTARRGGGLVSRRPLLRVAATGRGPEGEQKEVCVWCGVL
jgi:hypothetical protein